MQNILIMSLFLFLLACSSDEEKKQNNTASSLNHHSSECGGFTKTRAAEETSMNIQQPDSLTAEEFYSMGKIHWSYSKATEILSLLLTQVDFNCAALPVLQVEKVNNLYKLHDNDLNDGPGADCMCIFDLYTEYAQVSGDTAFIEYGSEVYSLVLEEQSGAAGQGDVFINIDD